MPTSSSATPPSESTLEARLFKRLDVFMTEIKEAFSIQDKKIDKQGEKLDRLTEEHVARDEFDALRRRVDGTATDVAVQGQRLKALENDATADDSTRRQRPIQTWQLLLMSAGVLTSLFFDFITVIISVVSLVLLVKK